MEIIISNNTSSPIYEQITTQIKELIINGDLKAGDSIPSVRNLARMLHISVMTVQKAYEDLQRDGYIETTVGRGSFVTTCNDNLLKEELQKNMEEYLSKAIGSAKANGIPLEKLIDLVTILYMEE